MFVTEANKDLLAEIQQSEQERDHIKAQLDRAHKAVAAAVKDANLRHEDLTKQLQAANEATASAETSFSQERGKYQNLLSAEDLIHEKIRQFKADMNEFTAALKISASTFKR